MSSELFAEKLKQWLSKQPNDSNRYVTDEEHAEMVKKKLLKFSNEEEKPSSSKEYRWVRSLAVVRYGGRRLQGGEESWRTGDTSCFEAF